MGSMCEKASVIWGGGVIPFATVQYPGFCRVSRLLAPFCAKVSLHGWCCSICMRRFL
jgi:hypothetical protein